tara:strand:+ start:244 stop:1059 length:816 start_codon:yes stop_codon:yes gene_type:complete
MEAVAKKESTAVANIMDDLFEAAGQGREAIGAEDMQIPFLRILQPLSPQLLKTDPKFIKGASAGDLFNTVTGEFWEADTGVKVLVCAFQTKFLEFGLRESGGGFMGEIDPNSPDIRQTTRNGPFEMLPSGNELVRSAQYLVLAYNEDGMTSQLVCDMKKTQMKVSKQWNTRRAGLKVMHPKGLMNPPTWATPWTLTTVQESNDKGSWFNFAVTQGDMSHITDNDLSLLPMSVLEEAKQMYNDFKAGEIKTSAATSDEMRSANPSDTDDVPF